MASVRACSTDMMLLHVVANEHGADNRTLDG
jgi:hypothetical protein